MKSSLKKILFITCENGFYCLKKIYEKKVLHFLCCNFGTICCKKINISGYIDVSSWCKKKKIKTKILKNYDLQIKDLKKGFGV